ncbi:unnamed protein product [Ilex paraguariensis]|uniref:Uncharacterized protein n=1 Tax=Ilex paraguariensis TaxID=185542 RepID=A0ABC8QUQ5_9AQUA
MKQSVARNSTATIRPQNLSLAMQTLLLPAGRSGNTQPASLPSAAAKPSSSHFHRPTLSFNFAPNLSFSFSSLKTLRSLCPSSTSSPSPYISLINRTRTLASAPISTAYTSPTTTLKRPSSLRFYLYMSNW